MAGFIYIMSNPSFVAGRIKIGKSDRDPEEFRKSELDGTAVPEPFKVEYYAFVDDHHTLEKELHEAFDHVRTNKQREFFDVSVDEVVSKIKSFDDIKIKFEMNMSTKTKKDSVGKRPSAPPRQPHFEDIFKKPQAYEPIEPENKAFRGRLKKPCPDCGF